MTLKDLKTSLIRVVSAYLTYRQSLAITNAVQYTNRALSLGQYCRKISGIFPPFPCCHTVLRANQQGRKTYNWRQHEKERTGKERTGKERTTKDRDGQKTTGKETTGKERTGEERTGKDRTGKERKGREKKTRKEREGRERGKWMTALLPTVTTRAKEAVHAATNHLTAVTTGVAAATRTTGVANLADTVHCPYRDQRRGVGGRAVGERDSYSDYDNARDHELGDSSPGRHSHHPGISRDRRERHHHGRGRGSQEKLRRSCSRDSRDRRWRSRRHDSRERRRHRGHSSDSKARPRHSRSSDSNKRRHRREGHRKGQQGTHSPPQANP